MPRPRTKMRFCAVTVRSRSARKGVPWVAADCWRRASASRAAAVGVGLTCLVPGSGLKVVGRRSGTETLIVMMLMLPEARGRVRSGPEMVRFKSALASTVSLETSCARLPVMRMSPGRPAAGSSVTCPRAESDPPFGVCAVRLSMASTCPRAESRAAMPFSCTPCSESTKLPFAIVTVPWTRGLEKVPATDRSRLAAPVTRCPETESMVLAMARSVRPEILSAISSVGSIGTLPEI